MGHVFSLEAIATCEQQGHEFAWVQTWHDVGFDECRRCGLTRPGDVYDWSGCRTAPSEQPIDVAFASDLPRPGGFHIWAVPATAIVPGSTVDDAASVAPPTDKRRRRGQPAKAARNEEIRRRRRKGESLASLAAAFGVHATRICQICKQGDTYKP